MRHRAIIGATVHSYICRVAGDAMKEEEVGVQFEEHLVNLLDCPSFQ